MRPIVFLVAILAFVGGIVGYLKTRDRVDTKEADAKLKAWAENVAPVDKVTCPEAKMKKGTTFQCKADFTGGSSYQIDVEVKDDHGEVEYHWDKPIIPTEKLAADIVSAEKTATGKDVKVDCGKGIVEVPADGLLCAASVGDAKGHYRVKLDPKSHDVVWIPEP
jgi:hypothetical protein